MLTKLVILKIASLLVDFVFFWKILLFLGRARNRLLFLDLLQKLSTCYGIYHQWDNLVMLVTCWYEFSLSCPTPMYCDNKSVIWIAHNSVFMKWPSIVRLIVTLLIITFSITLLLWPLFLLLYTLQICLPSHTYFLIFGF